MDAAQRGGRLAFAATIVVHLSAAGAVLGLSGTGPPVMPPVYRVELVAAPPPQPRARRAPQTVQRPAERPVPIKPPTRRTTVAETPPPPEKPTEEREPAPRTTPEETPVEKPSTGSDVTTVKVEGQEFPYPEYLHNIVSQVYRQWQRPSGNQALRAEVFFLVHRDGSISNLRFVRRSGSFGFDVEAQGAIEAAASSGSFGPLPAKYPDDVLPVSFFFDPQRMR